MFPRISIALGLLLSGAALAQNEGASLEGHLTDALSGAPLRRGAITLRPVRGATKSYITDSASDGAFSFTGLDAGAYRIFLEKPGYLNQEYGAKNYQFGGEIVIEGS